MTLSIDDGCFSVKMQADSTCQHESRISTFVVRYPRFIHAELLTHRQFSRNSSSSRAIPIKKLREKVLLNPAMPVYWGKNQRGMQAGEELVGKRLWLAKQLWLKSRYVACGVSWALEKLDLHKQVPNRLLEPWMLIDVIITATSFSNFFKLRSHKDAQPEIKKLSDMMMEVYKNSTPALVHYGDWHLPFITNDLKNRETEVLKKIAVARCARVSYTTHEGKIDVNRDVELYKQLINGEPIHFSPCEHVATPSTLGKAHLGNLVGWKSHRYELERNNETYKKE